MQTETWNAGGDRAARALTAEEVMRELAEQSRRSREYYYEHAAPTGAMKGLMLALPLSLGMWIVIAALVWMLLR